jgi:hypothetical protein
MSASNFQATFVRRFDRLWAQGQQVQVAQTICGALLTALSGLALLAALDYHFELALAVRQAALAAVGLLALGIAVVLTVRSLRRWRRHRTATAMEQVFPQLGQRIRTTIECAALSESQMQQAGLAPALVAALDRDTVELAQPLPLEAVVPWRSLIAASLAAVALLLGLAVACMLSWQWRAATLRALLGREPYTRILVEPGDVTVREGESLLVRITVKGRMGSEVTFQTRRIDEPDSPWRDERLTIDQSSRINDREAHVAAPLDRIRHPFEYRVAAGSAQSEIYRASVRYPLKIVRQEATIQPPAYTGLPEMTSEGGDVTALVGSHVAFHVELDREPTIAWIEMQSLVSRFPGEDPAVARLPVTIAGTKLSTEFDLTSDQTYAIVARSADGMELLPNRYRLRARPDEPPQIWFDSPLDTIEVHTLAEVLMRIRASDDFGLARAGIMFEVNNEEEYPLLAKDFEEAARELEKDGQLSPQTRATLEKVLPLEHFQLSQQDSVMYYAYAEDTRPGHAQRAETDLHFIDIRPFRRNYRPYDPPEGAGQGPRFKSLAEIINRQRYAVNRTIQLGRKQKYTGQPDLPATDALIKFEGELAQATRDFAEGLLQRGVDETELLFQAETTMLAAADSLAGGNFDTATLQMREALKYLIEGRNRLEIFILKNRDRRALAELRQFDRLQRQKLRRPKSDEQQARQIAERLEELASEEEALFGVSAASAPPEDLEDRQLDVAAEARTLERALTALPKATDLAKERMAAAAKKAEDVAEAIGRGEMNEAKIGAGEARDQFRELAAQIKTLLAAEQADRIAAAQRMAADLARRQQQLQRDLFAAGMSERQTGESRRGLGGRARDLAEKAKTLGDVLGAASQAETPADEKSAEQVARFVKALGLKGVSDRLEQLPAQIQKQQMAAARAALDDGAERMEMAAQQLGAAHRSLVAPKVEELSQLEQQALNLEKQLDQLDSDRRVTGWHVEANELLDKLEELGIDKELPRPLREEMIKAGWSGGAPPARWDWRRTAAGGFIAPASYRPRISHLTEELRGRMQEYLVGHTLATGEEPIPPQYQDLVDRYYRALAAERHATGSPALAPASNRQPTP